jgi:preprotein translocase subunit Sec63
VTVVVGWLVMGWMVYLMAVTARTIPKIWDPYDILGISRVCPYFAWGGIQEGMLSDANV